METLLLFDPKNQVYGVAYGPNDMHVRALMTVDLTIRLNITIFRMKPCPVSSKSLSASLWPPLAWFSMFVIICDLWSLEHHNDIIIGVFTSDKTDKYLNLLRTLSRAFFHSKMISALFVQVPTSLAVHQIYSNCENKEESKQLKIKSITQKSPFLFIATCILFTQIFNLVVTVCYIILLI